MSKQHLLGVDIGTTGSKGVVVTPEGRVVAYQFREHGVATPRPGWCEQDADAVWWADLAHIIRGLLETSGLEPAAIGGVGISGTCPNMLPVDDEGRPLCPGMLYSDGRAVQEIAEINDRIGEERIFQGLGRRLGPDSVGAKLLWLRKHEPEVFSRTRMVHTATSYLVFRLTGAQVIDVTSAFGISPLYSPARMDWDAEICGELGLPTTMFPRPRWSYEVAGRVTAEASRQTGLAVGTPVVVGACDAPAEAISTGAVSPGEASLLYGTTMIMGLILDPPAAGQRSLGWPMIAPGLYRAPLIMSTSGALTRWFRDNLGQMEKEAESQLGINAYSLLSEQAAEVPPGAEGLLALPYFSGERSPIFDPRARGLILGLTLSHTRKHVYRALLEGTAFGLQHGLEGFRQAGAQVTRIVATGGGTKSRVWTQIVSDVIGRDQEILKAPYGAPYGDAYLAGMGIGLFTDVTGLRDLWRQETSLVRWDPQRHEVYGRYFAIYRGLYETLKDDMHALAELSAARA